MSHLARQCPRRNGHPAGGSSNKRPRKVPIQALPTSVVASVESSIHPTLGPDLINVTSLETSLAGIAEEITHSLATSPTPVVEEISTSLALPPSHIRASAVSKYAIAPYTSARSHSTDSFYPRKPTNKTSSSRATCSSSMNRANPYNIKLCVHTSNKSQIKYLVELTPSSDLLTP